MARDLSAHITVNPFVNGGQPTVMGSNVMVGQVVRWIEGGILVEHLLDDFPGLTREDIAACLEFAERLRAAASD